MTFAGAACRPRRSTSTTTTPPTTPRGRRRRRRRRAARAPPGQGQRRAPDVPGHRGRRLRDGRRRRHLRRRGRAAARRAAGRRAPRHGRRPPRRDPPAAYRAGHRLGNRVLTGLVRWLFGAQIDRHAVRLPRVLAPVREELPVVLARVRDRDRAHRPRDADADAGAEIDTNYKERPPARRGSCARSATASRLPGLSSGSSRTSVRLPSFRC